MLSYTYRGHAEKYTEEMKECAARAQRAAVANILAEQEKLKQRLQAGGDEQISALQRKFTDALSDSEDLWRFEVKRLLDELKEERRAHGLLLGYAFASNAQHLEGEGRTGGRRVQQLVVGARGCVRSGGNRKEQKTQSGGKIGGMDGGGGLEEGSGAGERAGGRAGGRAGRKQSQTQLFLRPKSAPIHMLPKRMHAEGDVSAAAGCRYSVCFTGTKVQILTLSAQQ